MEGLVIRINLLGGEVGFCCCLSRPHKRSWCCMPVFVRSPQYYYDRMKWWQKMLYWLAKQ